MKFTRKMRGLKVIAGALIAIQLVLNIGTCEAYAANAVKTMKYYYFEFMIINGSDGKLYGNPPIYKTINKNALTVKKGKVTIKQKTHYEKEWDDYEVNGYLKFKAPATKTYKFTFSNLKGGKNPGIMGYRREASMQFFVRSGKKYLDTIDVKTNGGKTAIINIADKKTYNKWHKNKKKKVDQALVKSTVKKKKKKGEVVFINVTAGYAGKGTTSFNLEIK